MSDTSNPKKPVLRRADAVPTLLRVPDLRESLNAADPVEHSLTAGMDSQPLTVPFEPDDVLELLAADADTIAPGPQSEIESSVVSAIEPIAEPPSQPALEPATPPSGTQQLAAESYQAPPSLDELVAAATAPTQLSDAPIATAAVASDAKSEWEERWFTGNVRKDLRTIGTIAVTIVACALVAQGMKPMKSDSFSSEPNASSVAAISDPETPPNQPSDSRIEVAQVPLSQNGMQQQVAGGQRPLGVQPPVGQQQPLGNQPYPNQSQGGFSQNTRPNPAMQNQPSQMNREMFQQFADEVNNQQAPQQPAFGLQAPRQQQGFAGNPNQLQGQVQTQYPPQPGQPQPGQQQPAQQLQLGQPGQPMLNTPQGGMQTFNASSPGGASLHSVGQGQPTQQQMGAWNQGMQNQQRMQNQQTVDPVRSANRTRFGQNATVQTGQSMASAQQAMTSGGYPNTNQGSFFNDVKAEIQQSPKRVADQRATTAPQQHSRFDSPNYLSNGANR